MNPLLDHLYERLPVVLRQRDHDQGEPLRALLQVIAEQVDVVEEDIRQLYENWFIETCQDWAVPYIGDLIGYRPIQEGGTPGDVITPQGHARNKILIPRREVANTIRYRRRKGALALLEELARDVAEWPARAVEFYALLGWTQSVNHLRLERGRTVDLRQGDALDRLDGPFDELAHTVDVRCIRSRHEPQGRYNVPNVGLFVWRLRRYSVTRTQACRLEAAGPHWFTFSALGNDTPLYARPERESSPAHIAGERNVPAPIRRRAFEERVVEDGKVRAQASAAYYGEDKSLVIWAPDWPTEGAEQPIPRTAIVPADLSEGQCRPRKGTVAVDPVRGRMVFPPSQLPEKGVQVSYHYGFSADVGGGEYERPLRQPRGATIYRVGEGQLATINAALAQWDREKPDDAVIEITESGVYVERVGTPDPEGATEGRAIRLQPGQSLQLRAASGVRPILRLLDYQTAGLDSLIVLLSPDSRFTLDGLLIAGRGVHVESVPPRPPVEEGDQAQVEASAESASIPTGVSRSAPRDAQQDGEAVSRGVPARLEIRHCTLVPGWSLDNDCEPREPAEPSLEVWNVNAQVTVEHSVLGSVQVHQDEVMTDPIPIRISDSVVDATGSDCEGSACEALGAPGSAIAHAVLTVLRCTVFGKIMTHAIDLAENTIFDGLVQVARSQRGCMRFCYVRPGSCTPRHYNCQPDLARKAIEEEMRQEAAAKDLPEPSEAELDAAKRREEDRLRPQFNSRRYGTPTYCQLAHACAGEIAQGADDESEMGVFHDLYQPQRAANLRARLDEYTPAGMEAGIIYVS